MTLPSRPPGADVPGLLRAFAGWRELDVTGGSMLADYTLLDVPAEVDRLDEPAAVALTGALRPFDAAWLRIRILRLGAGAHTSAMSDVDADLIDRLRVVVPLAGQAVLDVGGTRVTLRPGEAGSLDAARRHRYANTSTEDAFLLLADGSAPRLLDALTARGPPPDSPGGLRRERRQADPPDPWRLRTIIATLVSGAPRGTEWPVEAATLLHMYRAAWAAGTPPTDLHALLDARLSRLQSSAMGKVELDTGMGLVDALHRALGMGAAREASGRGEACADPWFERPVFIVSPPRAGSTLLFETLSQARGVYTIGDESHQLIEGVQGLSPAAHGFASNRLAAADATPQATATMRARFMDNLRNRDGHRPDGWNRVRMLEKTPKNALRIPFLARAFPEARFIYLHRDPRQVLASMMDAWESGRFRTYPALPGWSGLPWSLLLVPGWQRQVGQPLAGVVAHQWAQTVGTLLDDLEGLGPDRSIGLDYARLLADPRAEVERLCAWAGLEWDRALGEALPLSRYTVSRPDPEKWRRRQADVEAALAPHAELAARAAAAAERPGHARGTAR